MEASLASESKLYTRYEHGNHPVSVSRQKGGTSYTLELPEGGKTFTSARSLLRHLHGGRDLHWTFDRYFRLGRHTAFRGDAFTQNNIFTVCRERIIAPRQFSPLIKTKPAFGIDLNQKAGDVRRLLFAGFGKRIIASGLCPEDVLQEVYKGIEVRNRGTCPYDPEGPGSFGHYVHMVCRCILNNYSKKQGRRAAQETPGILVVNRGSKIITDVSDADGIGIGLLSAFDEFSEPGRPTDNEDDALSSLRTEQAVEDIGEYLEDFRFEGKSNSRHEIVDLAQRILRLIAQGYSRTEITTIVDASPSRLKRAFALLRTQAKEWARDEQIA